MKKSILTLGKTLNKAEQKAVNGGKMLAPECFTDLDCGVPGCSIFGIENYCNSYGHCDFRQC
jgi:hypothetical protein